MITGRPVMRTEVPTALTWKCGQVQFFPTGFRFADLFLRLNVRHSTFFSEEFLSPLALVFLLLRPCYRWPRTIWRSKLSCLCTLQKCDPF